MCRVPIPSSKLLKDVKVNFQACKGIAVYVKDMAVDSTYVSQNVLLKSLINWSTLVYVIRLIKILVTITVQLGYPVRLSLMLQAFKLSPLQVKVYNAKHERWFQCV